MIQALFTLLIALPALAVIEYLAHRLVMHHETPLMPGTFDRHAVKHHRQGDNSLNIDISAWFALALASPALIALAALGLWTAAVVVAVVAPTYAVLWTGMHRAMHDVGGAWARRLPFYEALRRHHMGHHARPGRNFGTVFGPLLDYPLGTLSRKD